METDASWVSSRSTPITTKNLMNIFWTRPQGTSTPTPMKVMSGSPSLMLVSTTDVMPWSTNPLESISSNLPPTNLRKVHRRWPCAWTLRKQSSEWRKITTTTGPSKILTPNLWWRTRTTGTSTLSPSSTRNASLTFWRSATTMAPWLLSVRTH